MDMVALTVSRKGLQQLIDGFGTGIGDLRLRVKHSGVIGDEGNGAVLVASVGYYTHYLRLTTIVNDVEEPGSIAISDINAVRAFLKSGKDTDVHLQQDGESKMLYLTCGRAKIHLPGTGKVESFSHVPMIERIIKEAEENHWTQWSDRPLSCSGTLQTSDTQEAIAIHSVLGENPLYTVEFWANQSEMKVKAGKKSKGRMFVTAPIENAKGPEHKCTSVYGANFPVNLKCLPAGELNMYMGDDTPIVFYHDATASYLIIFDCDYEEGWQ